MEESDTNRLLNLRFTLAAVITWNFETLTIFLTFSLQIEGFVCKKGNKKYVVQLLKDFKTSSYL